MKAVGVDKKGQKQELFCKNRNVWGDWLGVGNYEKEDVRHPWEISRPKNKAS